MKHRQTFLGIGWKFPPTFDKKTRSVEMVSEYEDIQESLSILLSTHPGERILHPDFGCNLNVLAFESLDASTISYATMLITKAILNFEPRVTLENVDIDQDETEGVIYITLDYTVRKTNTRTNMVYPYYLTEGTDLGEKMLAQVSQIPSNNTDNEEQQEATEAEE